MNPQATKESFTSDGWLRTGDLGYYDDEQFFYIVDRLKELIKYNGYQVAPAELEAILVHHPKVFEAGVIGLPDEVAGELPIAFVVLKEGQKISEKELQAYVASTYNVVIIKVIQKVGYVLQIGVILRLVGTFQEQL